MTKYAAARAQPAANRPIWVGGIPPSAWSQGWPERPREVVEAGMRSLSETELSEIVGLAIARANKCHPAMGEDSILWMTEYNRTVVAFAVARALCQPGSADAPWWDYADLHVIQDHITNEGAAWLYARLEAAMIAVSPLASDEDPQELYHALAKRMAGVAHLSPERRSQAARHLRAVLDLLPEPEV